MSCISRNLSIFLNLQFSDLYVTMILEPIDIHCDVLIFISSFINLGLFSIVLVNLAKSLSILSFQMNPLLFY